MKFTLFLALCGLAAAAPGKKLVQRDFSPLKPRSARRAFSDSLPNQRTSSSALKGNSTEVEYSGNWAGAVLIGSGFDQVQGTITVPEVSGSNGAAASAWVGIDGDTCQTAILQTGISFYADGTFDAWYEWYPDYSYSFSGISVSVGDEIYMEVDASSKTKGVATLENLSTGQTVSYTFSSTPASLCETNAEWIVEAFEEDGSEVTLADFGTVTFTGCSASGSGGTVTPSGATIFDMEPSNKVLTDCSVSGSEVTCTYI